MVMVFDDQGKQTPEYQGQYQEVRGNILKDAPPTAVFAYDFTTSGELRKVAREEW
jgi:hypothetical protein